MSTASGPTRDWARITEIFSVAINQEGAVRERYLDQACAGDTALRAEVESLLAHAIDGLLGEPADAEPVPERTGEMFGNYRIIRRLGQGGMGSVYLAERGGAGFTQRVALKLLRRDLFHALSGTPGLEQRFARERQILARLEHPGIARLIDGGYGNGGQPFLAMEYVEGESLTEFVRKRDLDVDARLRLFIAIAEAVQYAHQRLVIHCDLKPSNILIQESGDPKLLDFGVATLAETEDGERPGETSGHHSGFWFTPGYASPEQVRGERVTTLSDVYTLGILLYELLTGWRPYDVHDLSPAAIQQVVCERIPERPSLRVSEPSLARRLRGDLDTIVLKALAKEPERRYRSAQGLAEDLRRHLEHEPVKARPDTLGYRISTFVRRNRAAVSGAVLALVLLTAGLITTTWQARAAAAARLRAESALQQSEEVTDFVVGVFLQGDPNVAPVNAAFAEQLLERARIRVDELGSQPAVQARLLDALGQLFLNLGRTEAAHTATAQGLMIRRRTFGNLHPDVAASLQHLGRLERVNGQYQHAELLNRQALAILRETTGTETAAYADALSDLAFLLPFLARVSEAEAAYREVLAIRRRTLKPEDPLLAETLIKLAYTLHSQGKYAEAESAAREALALRQQALGPLNPSVGQLMINVADLIAWDSTRWAEAEWLYRGGIAMVRRTMGDQYLGLVHGTGNLGELLQRERRFAEAESLMTRVLELREAGLGPDHYIVALDRGAIADIWADEGRLDEAIRVRRTVVDAVERSMGPDHPAVAGSQYELAVLYMKKGDLDHAEPLLERSMAIRLQLQGPTHLQVGRCQELLGEIAVRRHQYQRAEQALTDALRILSAIGSTPPEEMARVRANLVLAYRGLGRPSEAARFAEAGSP